MGTPPIESTPTLTQSGCEQQQFGTRPQQVRLAQAFSLSCSPGLALESSLIQRQGFHAIVKV
jgi:hypothetical protein